MMNKWWADFGKAENERRIAEMKAEIARLKKELEGAEIPNDLKIGEYPITITPCWE